MTYLKEFVPRSWFHPKGIAKVLNRFWHRLPNVSGCLFATLTIDRDDMISRGYGPSEAFDITRDRVRRMFHQLRKGVKWEGKTYRIEAEYCTKVEFHEENEGWPHYHVIWLTRRFVPAELIARLWGYGFVKVNRIKNKDFHYLLKYVCKSGEIPDWVQDRTRIRIFQPSRGFLKPDPNSRNLSSKKGERIVRKTTTIRERLKKWERLAILITEFAGVSKKKVREVVLFDSFKVVFDRLVYAVALDGRYLGNGKIQITNNENLYEWILKKYQSDPV